MSTIIEHDFGGETWYVVSVRFASAYMAKETWEHVDRSAKERHLDVGLYRHGSTEDPGRYLTAVTHRRDSALRIKRMTNGVERNPLSAQEIDAFILRRLEVIAARDFQPGRVAIRHPENRGAKLYPDGTLEEQVGRG